MKALRKLNKFYPSKNQNLYRSIKDDIDLDKYSSGNTKIFWGFTSTSQNASKAYNFLGNKDCIKCGTIFTFTGKVWGYDIQLFNVFNEDEILLEPERKIQIKDVLPKINNIIHVTCKVLDTSIVLEQIFEKEKLLNKCKIEYNLGYTKKSTLKQNESCKNIIFTNTNYNKNEPKLDNLNINQLISDKNKYNPINKKDNTKKEIK